MNPDRMVAVIMAGGGGTRFWPRSRRMHPKQYLSFDGKHSLLEQTVARLDGLIPKSRTLVITSKDHVRLAEQHAGLGATGVFGEPDGKDTAACIGVGALLANQIQRDAIMVVLSADHLISPVDVFQRTLVRAAELAESSGKIVTMGVRPDRPATGYGYIEIGAREDSLEPAAFKVVDFREKPNLETAKRFVLGGNFLWNSGMFVFRTDTILRLLEKHMPDHAAILHSLTNLRDEKLLSEAYARFKKIPIDKGVLEQAPSEVLVVEARFDWDDLGTFEAVARHATKHDHHNLARGEAVFSKSEHSLIDNDGDGLVVVSGLSNVLVVRTKDAVLVMPRADAEKVKDLVDELKAKGFERYL